MYWLTARSVALCWPSFAPYMRTHIPHRYFLTSSSSSSSSYSTRQHKQVYCSKDNNITDTKSAKKLRERNDIIEEKEYPHIMWWKEKMQICIKLSSAQMVKRLVFSNLLGLDDNLKNGSIKEGTLNSEILKFKSRFPREVLLCRVGDFYEAIGFDACILVEYAGLNPCGGLRSDSIPKAGCPVVNLRQTLDDLTRNGFSVCIVEEVQGPTQARSRKSRFISGHAHPGSPYVFGLVEDDRDLEFPEPMPVVGISRSAKGYCMVSVLETMKTFSSEDSLTEEALVTKLRTCRYHHLYLHTSLKNNSSGTSNWREFGEGGLLWAECNGRHFEWIQGDMLNEILFKVKELYGLDDKVSFRNVTVFSENKPRPLHLGTASQIGAIQTEGIPYLLKILLPSNCTGLPAMYVRDILLNPPAYAVASTIQDICKLMSKVSCTIPEFTCISPSKLVKLLELREANHVEFCKIKNVLDEILQLYRNSDLNEILRLLMDPTWVATGLKIDLETLVNECESVSCRIGELISLEGESDQKMNSYMNIPSDFFKEMESLWKGRVKRIHLAEAYEEVEKAAEALSLAVTEDFLPIISRIRATTSPLEGPRGEILYAREHKAVWFKGKRFAPAVWAGTPGEEQIKQLRPCIDSKRRKVGEEWFTTVKVDDALTRYHEANANAKAVVLELLRGLSAELQAKVNILIFASMLLVIAKALVAHVSEGRRRKWVFPTLIHSHDSEGNGHHGMKITGLSPYWFEAAEGGAVQNTIDMKSMFLLTGPNGGGKSSLLRSICAAALCGICGFMVHAESAVIPQFDSIMLHMKSFDSPADGKSSFQIEMSELRSIIMGATSKSLVLVDEICRGTETAKGTCIAGSIVETLDSIGCLGIVSTHLHDVFKLPLTTKNTVFKAMGSEYVDGETKPTWKLIDGICKESLAFETAKREGFPETIIQRAQDLYTSLYTDDMKNLEKSNLKVAPFSSSNDEESHKADDNHITRIRETSNIYTIDTTDRMDKFRRDVESVVSMICESNTTLNIAIRCCVIGPRQQPPPSTIGASSVYIILRPDNRLYVGETDDLEGRVRAHRSKQGMHASFLYFLVPGKSMACQLETLLINWLPKHGFQLMNVADGEHRNFGTCDVSLIGGINIHR